MRKGVCVILLMLGCLVLTSSCDPITETDNYVYITETGTKYHRSGCRYLDSSSIKIERSTAQAQGYEACGVCKP